MSTHTVELSWADDRQFAAGRYSRAHQLRFDGGAVISGSASPHVVPLPFSDPAGVDPEELLVASVSACHMLWFLSLAQQAGFIVRTYRDEARGEMGRIGPGKQGMTRITLRPDIAFSGAEPSPAELAKVHHEAHERCFIANSIKAEISIEPPLPG